MHLWLCCVCRAEHFNEIVVTRHACVHVHDDIRHFSLGNIKDYAVFWLYLAEEVVVHEVISVIIRICARELELIERNRHPLLAVRPSEKASVYI